MDDTHPIIKAELNRRLMSHSGEARLIMGSRMFDTCRDMVLASMPKHLSNSEIKAALFLRFYGDEFDAKELASILDYFRSMA